MANEVESIGRREYAQVDSDPGADYFTNPVNLATINRGKIYFSVRDMGGSFDATVTVQFKCPGDSDWSQYNTYTSNERLALEGGGEHVLWRAGIKNGEYTSGTVRFGFDW